MNDNDLARFLEVETVRAKLDAARWRKDPLIDRQFFRLVSEETKPLVQYRLSAQVAENFLGHPQCLEVFDPIRARCFELLWRTHD